VQTDGPEKRMCRNAISYSSPEESLHPHEITHRPDIHILKLVRVIMFKSMFQTSNAMLLTIEQLILVDSKLPAVGPLPRRTYTGEVT
jgi:hypothetical protein